MTGREPNDGRRDELAGGDDSCLCFVSPKVSFLVVLAIISLKGEMLFFCNPKPHLFLFMKEAHLHREKSRCCTEKKRKELSTNESALSSDRMPCVAMADRVSCPGASFSSTRNHPQHLRSRGRQKKTWHVSRGTHRPGRRPSTTAPLDPIRVGQFVIITTAYCTNITIVRSNVRGCDWKTDRTYVEYPIGPDAEAKSDSPTPLVQLIISQLRATEPALVLRTHQSTTNIIRLFSLDPAFVQ
ncbi:hypothetical protein GW17_00000104 [Ensete ventricosum]|nr:hypothetical protein GW17_00000104 [Ensete ventricosum]